MSFFQDIAEFRPRLQEIVERNGVRRLRFFGSCVTGASSADSDVDVLVVLEEGRDLLDLVGLKLDLEELFNREVDVVEEGGLSPYLRDRILQQAKAL
jgi:hypothetical protein